MRLRLRGCLGILTASALQMTVASLAPAAIRPFVFLGGQGAVTEREITDDRERLLEPYTVTDGSTAWEGGAGLRLFSLEERHQIGGLARWEIRLRYARSGGDLPAVKWTNSRYGFHVKETSSYAGWGIGASFLVRPRPRIGLFAGPMLQSMTFKGKRHWDGPVPQFCYQCGEGEDRSTVRYGLLEVGTRVTPFSVPLSLEGFWVPKRFELSTTRTVQSPNYKANFSTLTRSFGGRLTYDF